MKGDLNLFKHATKPYLAVLVLGVGGGLTLGGAYLYHKLKNDPSLLVRNKKENPYPYLHVRQNENLKLYAVNAKFENDEKKPFW